LPELVSPETGRIHATFNQTVAATGRLSSADPNLQNIPIRTAEGRRIRAAFVAEPGHLLLSADYSQIELRIMAHISGDDALRSAFLNGEDIHTTTAAGVFGVPAAEVTKEMRRRAKEVNFGIMYGIGPFGLANRLGIAQSEARDIIARYFTRFPKVKEYITGTIASAKSRGYVETLLGRRRYLPDLASRNQAVRGNAERAAINMPIQGTAADMIKLAMINIDRELRARSMAARMLLQVHDELVFEVPEGERKEAEALVLGKMQTALRLDVPIVVEAGFGNDWLAAH
jgi:DNA polymerase-1